MAGNGLFGPNFRIKPVVVSSSGFFMSAEETAGNSLRGAPKFSSGVILPMVRQGSLLLFLSLCIMFFGCKNSTGALREQGELQGKIYVLGNEPFTKVGLALDDEHSIVLLCPPDVDQYLRSHQGGQVKVTYDGLSQVPEGQAVRVTKAEVVNQ